MSDSPKYVKVTVIVEDETGEVITWIIPKSEDVIVETESIAVHGTGWGTGKKFETGQIDYSLKLRANFDSTEGHIWKELHKTTHAKEVK